MSVGCSSVMMVVISSYIAPGSNSQSFAGVEAMESISIFCSAAEIAEDCNACRENLSSCSLDILLNQRGSITKLSTPLSVPQSFQHLYDVILIFN